MDLAHNFVLAHLSCNCSKSDTLAALPHLERWLERLQRKISTLAEIGAEAFFVTDPLVSGRWGLGPTQMPLYQEASLASRRQLQFAGPNPCGLHQRPYAPAEDAARSRVTRMLRSGIRPEGSDTLT